MAPLPCLLQGVPVHSSQCADLEPPEVVTWNDRQSLSEHTRLDNTVGQEGISESLRTCSQGCCRTLSPNTPLPLSELLFRGGREHHRRHLLERQLFAAYVQRQRATRISGSMNLAASRFGAQRQDTLFGAFTSVLHGLKGNLLSSFIDSKLSVDTMFGKEAHQLIM